MTSASRAATVVAMLIATLVLYGSVLRFQRLKNLSRTIGLPSAVVGVLFVERGLPVFSRPHVAAFLPSGRIEVTRLAWNGPRRRPEAELARLVVGETGHVVGVRFGSRKRVLPAREVWPTHPYPIHDGSNLDPVVIERHSAFRPLTFVPLGVIFVSVAYGSHQIVEAQGTPRGLEYLGLAPLLVLVLFLVRVLALTPLGEVVLLEDRIVFHTPYRTRSFRRAELASAASTPTAGAYGRTDYKVCLNFVDGPKKCVHMGGRHLQREGSSALEEAINAWLAGGGGRST